MSVHVRPARVADGAACAAIYDPIVIGSATSFESEPPGVWEMRRRIAAVTQRYPWLMAELEGLLVGYAYANRHRERAAYRWAVDVAVYVDECAHRQGVATALYRRLFELLAECGYRRAYAAIALPNEASVNLHAAHGFETIGTYRRVGYKLGRWWDVVAMGRTLGDDSEDPPAEPMSFAELVSSSR